MGQQHSHQCVNDQKASQVWTSLITETQPQGQSGILRNVAIGIIIK